MEANPLPRILGSIRAIPSLSPQERHVVLQELVAMCSQQDLEHLRRLLKAPTAPGYDALSCLPQELTHRIFRFVDAWDLMQLLAVCISWRRILLRDATLWKEKLLERVPAASMIVMETLASDGMGGISGGATDGNAFSTSMATGWLKSPRMLNKRSIGEGLVDASTSERLRRIARMAAKAYKADSLWYDHDTHDYSREERRVQEEQEEQQLQALGWRRLLTRELSVEHNWDHGRCLGDMHIISHKDIKPVLLAWPYLFVGQGYTGVRVIHLNRLKQHLGSLARNRPSSHSIQPYYRGGSSNSNPQGPNNLNTIDSRAIPDSVLFEVPHFMTTLAFNQHEGAGANDTPSWGYGLMNSGVGWSDFRNKCIDPLFNLHYNAIAHVAFLKNRFLSINLTGRLLLTSINPDSRRTIFAQAQITRDGKILQVETTSFTRCERLYHEKIVEWEEAIFLGHEDGILILDEEARPIHEITEFDSVRKHRGGKLIQFQVFNEAERQEVLALYEDSTTDRRRRVISIELEDGFSREISRKELLGDPPFDTDTASNTTTIPRMSKYQPQKDTSAANESAGASPSSRTTTIPTSTTKLTSDPYGYLLPLGRGGDARDSVVMHRDRVGIVSHRYCNFDLGHYCVLQVVNVRTGHGFSTDQTRENKILHNVGLSRRDQRHSHHSQRHGGRGEGGAVVDLNGSPNHDNWRMLPIDLSEHGDGDLSDAHDQFAALQSEHIVVQGGQLACRILAMDHARIVLGIGSTTLRIIWL